MGRPSNRVMVRTVRQLSSGSGGDAKQLESFEAEPAGSLKLALGMAVVLTLAIGIYPTIATFVREAAQVLATGT